MPCFNTPSGMLRKKRPFEPKIGRFTLLAVIVGLSVDIERFVNKHFENKTAGAIVFVPNLHLWDSRFTAIALVLGDYLKQASWQRSLHCKYWRHENETS